MIHVADDLSRPLDLHIYHALKQPAGWLLITIDNYYIQCLDLLVHDMQINSENCQLMKRDVLRFVKILALCESLMMCRSLNLLCCYFIITIMFYQLPVILWICFLQSSQFYLTHSFFMRVAS